MGAPKKFLSYMKDYDFSSSKDVRLVHSLQGEQSRLFSIREARHAEHWSWITGKYTDGDEFDKGGGLASLAKSVKSLGFSKGGKWEVEGTVRLLFAFLFSLALLTHSSNFDR